MLTKRSCTFTAMFLSAGFAYSALEMSRFTIDGGGAIRSTGGDFELSGTIGQPDAGVLTGGSFTLTGGFWFALSAMDCNEDGLNNLTDHESFTQCFSGPSNVVVPLCACFDSDGDGEVTLRDFAAAQIGYTGH